MREATRHNPHKISGFRRLARSLSNSLEGIGATLRHEEAFRQEVMISVVLVPVAILLPIPMFERLYLIGALFLILIVELLNSAVEAAIDYISLRSHPLAKRSKDMASGAVFCSLLHGILVWSFVLSMHWETIWGE
ncbi:MAG: diacylglycerol kinase [Puniceicoccaceae bacterium]